MSDHLTIVVGDDGTLGLIHDDELQLQELGHVRSRRASHVEHDDDRQEWVATLVDGTEVASSPERRLALRAEVDHLNKLNETDGIEAMFAARRLRITEDR